MDDEHFATTTELSIVVPQNTELNIKDLFTESDNTNEITMIRTADSIEPRSLLFFDEVLPIYIALRISSLDEDEALKPFFRRLNIALELRASGSAPRNSATQDESRDTSPERREDVIWTGTLVAAEDPTIIRETLKEGETQRELLAVWEIKALLNRPRIRLQSPKIIFIANAMLQPRRETIEQAMSDPYLPSGLPQSQNLFEPLSNSTTSENITPSLTRNRLHSVQPLTGVTTIRSKPVKVKVPNAFRALPAISSRVRYHKATHAGAKASLVASLDLEIAPFSTDDIELISLGVTLLGGSALDLGQGQIPCLPLRCKTRDKVVFLYRLFLDSLQESTIFGMSRTLDITINGSVMTSDQCRPVIQMHWKTSVDFSSALNWTYNGPRQTMQRYNKPSQLSVPGLSAESVEARRRSRAVSVSDVGVTITFTGPPKAYVHEPFAWEVLVLNGSGKPKRLTLTAITKMGTNDATEERILNTTSNNKESKKTDTADGVVDADVLYAMQKMRRSDPARIISLSADVETGSLLPGACCSTQLNFMAFERGHFQIEAVKVVDLASKDAVEVRDLPDIVVE